MMSEKRFYLGNNDTTICDRSQGGSDGFNMLTIFKVVDLLNEQQTTITKLEQICEKKMQEIEDIKYSLKEIAYKYRKEVQFKADTDPNQAVKEVLSEQQATIRRLQDLCGESDGENAKLRIENKRLEEENRELRQSVEYWQKKYEEGTETFQIN